MNQPGTRKGAIANNFFNINLSPKRNTVSAKL